MKRNELRFLISQRVPSLSAPTGAHRDVGVAAERAFLHVAVADLQVPHQRVDLLQVRDRFLRRAHVGLGDDFQQRRAGAIQVDARLALKVFVQRLAGVLFEVRARDADSLARAVVEHDLQPAFLHDRLLVLADLIALRQIGIEVVLAREHRAARDRRADREAELHRHAHRVAIQHRQHARIAEVDEIRLRVRRSAVGSRRAREDLAARRELRVDLQTDDSFPASHS